MATEDLLRTFVRSVILEDVTALKKWALGGENEEERALAKIGVIPIGRGKEGTSDLGEGLYNKVREVVYKGKRAAARYSAKKSELESLLRFLEYRNQLPAKYRKHFPKLYTTFEFVTDSGKKYYGAVLELLERMPAALEHELDRISLRDGTLQRSRLTLASTPKVVQGAIPDNTSPEHRKALLTFFRDELLPLLNSMLGEPLVDVDEKMLELSDIWVHKNPRVNYPTFVSNIFKALRGEVIPYNADADSANPAVINSHPSKAVRHFYEFLLALKQHGLAWEDMHTGNFMMRPGTNEFVVVDPGMFRRI